MRETRWGQRSPAPPPRPACVGMLGSLAGAVLAFAPPAAGMAKDGYRGIPAFVQVTSVEVTSSAEVNRALVCYRLSSALPAVTLRADAAERFPASPPAAGAPHPAAPPAAAPGAATPPAAAPTAPPPAPGPAAAGRAYGKPRPAGAGDRSVIFDSTFQRVEPAQLTFFSSIPRFSASGAPRKVALTSRRATRLEYPGFERVDFCETTDFEKALGPAFIKALFESPFMVGDLTGTVAFRLELVEDRERPRRGPAHETRGFHGADRDCPRATPGRSGPAARARPCRRRVLDVLQLAPAEHVVPIFGKNADVAAEQLTIEAAAASNAALFLDSGMPPELVASEGDAALNDTLLTTYGIQRARPSGSRDCRRFLGALREAVVARRLSRPRPDGEGSRPGAERAASPAGGAR